MELMNFYGSINEQKMGVKPDSIEKPEAMILWEKCQEIGLPLVDGGLMDQPYIWLQEVAVIKNTKALFDLANQRSTPE